ncbi:MAG: Crp/Fnr family transcriptional regulator [Pseudomonadota bacterium]
MKKIGIEVLAPPRQECASCPVRHRALFSPLLDERLGWAEKYRANQALVPAKHSLFLEGETAGHAYTLFEGWVAVYKTLANGKRQITRFALPGDFLGFQSDMDGPMSYAAVTITKCVLCAFPRTSMRTMFTEYPEVAAQMASINARYMELCQYHLMGTGRQSALERIAFLLLELFHRTRTQAGFSDQGNGVPFPICQEEIADAVGLTTVHVNRILKEMRERGLVECASRRLRITDEPALSEIAGFTEEFLQSPAVL